MFYLIKTPWWLKKIYPSLVWNIPAEEKTIYLTFDDGPHETATPLVLRLLQQYHAKATFFCIGDNVVKNPSIYNDILQQGHAVGNHTFNHLDGWKTGDEAYLQNIAQAAKHIRSNLFRPPYGRIKKFQAKLLQQVATPFSIIMWTVLSGDFDTAISPQQCLQNVVKHTGAGSIVVFHDSAKAYQRMAFALPKVLEHFTEKGYVFKALQMAENEQER
ncbi:MAG TPA: polysaccharide deacetylase family protein [Chitinophagaceae bacterium]|nr:polysaccharide deacetylase family protein [Chitinophagaceae bacterium]